MVGSHHSVSQIAGAVEFDEDLLAAVERERPDVVLLRAAGHGAVPVADVARCPVPVVGLLHDWVAWGSERLEAVARTVDWLITEKSAYRYLRAAGFDNVSTYLLMSREGVERVEALSVQAQEPREWAAAFLGSFYLHGVDNPLRRSTPDARGRHHEAMMARLGFRARSRYVAEIASSRHPTFVAASTEHLRCGPDHNPSFDVVARSHFNVHVDCGRQHAANRCFESLAIGTPLICEAGNELFDYLPEGMAIPFTLGTFDEVLDACLTNPRKYAEVARAAREFARTHFRNDTLAEGLRRHIVDRRRQIERRFETRRFNALDQRAPVHWEGRRLYHREIVTPHLESMAKTPAGENELGVYAYEAAFVEGEAGALDRAIQHLSCACELDPHNANARWNLAVARFAATGETPRADLERLMSIAEAGASQFRWSGSRLELAAERWLSAHVEHGLCLAKIEGDHAELEARAFRHRAAVFLGLREGRVHWPELPDEHECRGDLQRACALDPLLRPSTALRDRIEDCKRASTAA